MDIKLLIGKEMTHVYRTDIERENGDRYGGYPTTLIAFIEAETGKEYAIGCLTERDDHTGKLLKIEGELRMLIKAPIIAANMEHFGMDDSLPPYFPEHVARIDREEYGWYEHTLVTLATVNGVVKIAFLANAYEEYYAISPILDDYYVFDNKSDEDDDDDDEDNYDPDEAEDE